MAKYLDDNGLLYFWSKLIGKFVAKEAGKGLSTNDLTNTLKSNYDAAYTHSTSAHAPSGAEANVQSDWNVTDAGSDAFILNKPTIPAALTVDSALSASSENPVQNKVINTALGNKIDSSTKGQANGVASLDADGLVPSAQLPSYVDDVIELVAMSATAPETATTGDMYYKTSDTKIYTATGTNTWGGTGATPEKSKIYINLATNISYRWGGSEMVQITSTDLVAITNGEIDTVAAS